MSKLIAHIFSIVIFYKLFRPFMRGGSDYCEISRAQPSQNASCVMWNAVNDHYVGYTSIIIKTILYVTSVIRNQDHDFIGMRPTPRHLIYDWSLLSRIFIMNTSGASNCPFYNRVVIMSATINQKCFFFTYFSKLSWKLFFSCCYFYNYTLKSVSIIYVYNKFFIFVINRK